MSVFQIRSGDSTKPAVVGIPLLHSQKGIRGCVLSSCYCPNDFRQSRARPFAIVFGPIVFSKDDGVDITSPIWCGDFLEEPVKLAREDSCRPTDPALPLTSHLTERDPLLVPENDLRAPGIEEAPFPDTSREFTGSHWCETKAVPRAATPTQAENEMEKVPRAVTPTQAENEMEKLPRAATPTQAENEMEKLPRAVTPTQAENEMISETPGMVDQQRETPTLGTGAGTVLATLTPQLTTNAELEGSESSSRKRLASSQRLLNHGKRERKSELCSEPTDCFNDK